MQMSIKDRGQKIEQIPSDLHSVSMHIYSHTKQVNVMNLNSVAAYVYLPDLVL